MKLVGSLLLALTSGAHGALDSAQKTALTLKHNTLRASVGQASHNQPCTAGDMQEVVWDDALATGAQTWADACVGDHDPKAAQDFGENLFMVLSGSDTSTKVLESSVQGWYDEYKDTMWAKAEGAPVTKKQGDCIEKDGDKSCNIGHYFQVIWSKVSKIGCGVKSCSSGLTVSGTKHANGVLVVCRYDANPPGKDLKGQAPYMFGKKCGGCEGSCSTSPAGLCKKAPTRCVDRISKSNSITTTKKFESCKALLEEYPASHATPWCTKMGPLMDQCPGAKCKESCPLSCKTCTVPTGMGSAHCGAQATGVTTGATGVTTGPTSGAVATPTVLTGSMNLNVPNPAAFLKDMKAQTAVKEGIAALLKEGIPGINSSWIALVVTAARRLEGFVAIDDGRRLNASGNNMTAKTTMGAVKVAYTITIPANVPLATAPETTLSGLTVAALTTSIKGKLGAGYESMSVTSKTAVANSKPPKKGTASGAVGMFIFGPAALLVVAVLHQVN